MKWVGKKWAEPKILCKVNVLFFSNTVLSTKNYFQRAKPLTQCITKTFNSGLYKEWSKVNPVYTERLVLVALQCNVIQQCECEAELPNRKVAVFHHPPYPPDLTPLNNFSPPKSDLPCKLIIPTHNTNASYNCKGTEQHSERGLPRTD
jgi:hypothetical protein